MRWVTVDRVLWVGLLALVAWQARELQQQGRQMNQLGAALQETAATVTEVRDQRAGLVAEMWRACDAGTADAGGPRGGVGGAVGGPVAGARPRRELLEGGDGGGAAARRKDPGQAAMNRLYDAADRMAAEEGWDPATYDAVTAVFEDGLGVMIDLWGGLQSGDVPAAAARDEALALRDDVQARLLDVLGPEGVERLKTHLKRRRGP